MAKDELVERIVLETSSNEYGASTSCDVSEAAEGHVYATEDMRRRKIVIEENGVDRKTINVGLVCPKDGRWIFIEAGPGSCAGTGHEAVFKAVARRLLGEEFSLVPDAVGGGLAV